MTGGPQPPQHPAATLGDVLYARRPASTPQERGWVGLLRRVALRDQVALNELFERSHGVVFAIACQVTGDRTAAEGLVVEVFRQVVRGAGAYDPADGTVLGWIAAQARARALERLRAFPKKTRTHSLSLRELQLAPATRTAVARLIRVPAGGQAKPPAVQWIEPDWEEVAPGISCKLLSSDSERKMVSMLVRLAPGASYPPHTHAAREELHLLEGELWIEDRLLRPGDYSVAEPGTADHRVYSATGCVCLLVTSESDRLG